MFPIKQAMFSIANETLRIDLAWGSPRGLLAREIRFRHDEEFRGEYFVHFGEYDTKWTPGRIALVYCLFDLAYQQRRGERVFDGHYILNAHCDKERYPASTLHETLEEIGKARKRTKWYSGLFKKLAGTGLDKLGPDCLFNPTTRGGGGKNVEVKMPEMKLQVWCGKGQVEQLHLFEHLEKCLFKAYTAGGKPRPEEAIEEFRAWETLLEPDELLKKWAAEIKNGQGDQAEAVRRLLKYWKESLDRVFNSRETAELIAGRLPCILSDEPRSSELVLNDLRGLMDKMAEEIQGGGERHYSSLKILGLSLMTHWRDGGDQRQAVRDWKRLAEAAVQLRDERPREQEREDLKRLLPWTCSSDDHEAFGHRLYLLGYFSEAAASFRLAAKGSPRTEDRELLEWNASMCRAALGTAGKGGSALRPLPDRPKKARFNIAVVCNDFDLVFFPLFQIAEEGRDVAFHHYPAADAPDMSEIPGDAVVLLGSDVATHMARHVRPFRDHVSPQGHTLGGRRYDPPQGYAESWQLAIEGRLVYLLAGERQPDTGEAVKRFIQEDFENLLRTP